MRLTSAGSAAITLSKSLRLHTPTLSGGGRGCTTALWDDAMMRGGVDGGPAGRDAEGAAVGVAPSSARQSARSGGWSLPTNGSACSREGEVVTRRYCYDSVLVLQP